MNYLDSVALIIPSLDPDEKLLGLLNNLEKSGFSKIVLINDGSSSKYDNYYKTAKEIYNCHVIKHNVNLGKGRALKNAFNYILNEFPECVGAVSLDSDGQHLVEDIKKCCESTVNNKDSLIMGCRDFSNQSKDIPLRSRFGNVMTSKVLKGVCGIDLPDTQTGLRGFSRKLLKTFMSTKGERFEFEMNMLLDAKQNNIPIEIVPISTVYIEENKTSHFNPLVDSLKIYSVFLKFILSSLSSFVIDIALFSIFVFIFKKTEIGPENYILLSTLLARIISAIFNYSVNKSVVFKNNNNNKALFKYIILFAIQLVISAKLVTFVFNSLNMNLSIIKIIIDTLLFLISFRIQREWVFKNV